MRAGTTKRSVVGAVLALAVAIIGCERPDPERPPADTGMEMPGMPGIAPEGRMEMAPGMMERHADEAEAMAAEMRAHLDEMRRLPAAARHERMGEHARSVSRMLALLNRQIREMAMGMPMDDEAMGALMGMSADEHRRMMDDMQALRAELEELQTAPVAELGQRMPAHLDRTERLVDMLERSAGHMRRAQPDGP